MSTTDNDFSVTGAWQSVRGTAAAPAGGVTIEFTPRVATELAVRATNSAPPTDFVGTFAPKFQTAIIRLDAGQFAFARTARVPTSGNPVAKLEQAGG